MLRCRALLQVAMRPTCCVVGSVCLCGCSLLVSSENGGGQKQVLRFVFALPSADDMAALAPLLALVPLLTDLVRGRGRQGGLAVPDWREWIGVP